MTDRRIRGALQVSGSAAVAAYAWWVAGLLGFSHRVTAAVLAGGVVALLVGATRAPRDRPPPPRTAWVVAWAVVVAALGALQLVSYLGAPRSEHPTLSSLANATLDTRPARAVGFAGWLVVAAALGRR